jgi:probable rRNA maturation factor
VPRRPYTIIVQRTVPRHGTPSTRWVREVVQRTLEEERIRGPLSLTVRFVTEEEIRELNRQFRDEDEVTDVLSFPLEPAEGEFVLPPGTLVSLGDLAICVPYVRRRAEALGQDVERHLAHVLVHGVLHLLGYDHATPQEEAAMRAREEAALSALSLRPEG